MRSVLLAACLVLAAGCASQGEASRTSATVPVESTVKREVETAYLRAFRVYVSAVRNLDDSELDTAFAGTALETVTAEVADLKAAGTPVRYVVEHDYVVTVLDRDHAVVVDRYINHSVLLDGRTGEPLEADPNERLEYTYSLTRTEAGWRITSIE